LDAHHFRGQPSPEAPRTWHQVSGDDEKETVADTPLDVIGADGALTPETEDILNRSYQFA
jgi:hypothetical protein